MDGDRQWTKRDRPELQDDASLTRTEDGSLCPLHPAHSTSVTAHQSNLTAALLGRLWFIAIEQLRSAACRIDRVESGSAGGSGVHRDRVGCGRSSRPTAMRLITSTLSALVLLVGPALAQAPAGRATPNPFTPGAKPATTAPAKPTPAPAQKPAEATPAGAVFPTAISPKYASESAGKARQKTCLDQYNANKAGGGAGNAGLKWIQKGGGYYSECNKRLKS